jgi:hypothetical protein
MQTNKLKTVSSLLSEALKQTMTINDYWITQIRANIKSALRDIEKHEQRKTSRATAHDEWWKNVTAGVAEGHTAPEASIKSLAQLNAMLKQEYENLEALEAASTDPKLQKQTSKGLLND